MEASAIHAPVGLTRTRIAIGASLLRIRTDDQLVALFREGNDEAFRVIHDRYRARMLAYARQMLGSSGRDPEDAVQEIFMRAHHGLRASDRQLALRAWLYRIAHNRCIDDLRRPQLLAITTGDPPAGGVQDPVIKVEQRDALRRLIGDVQQLPGQQRSALLMRELSGMSYLEVSGALGVTVPAVKSLLVRARVGLAQASEARNTACAEIRADLIVAHDRGVRTSGLARRHLRECPGCREFRTEVRSVSRQLAVLTPTLGPLGVIANLLGLGGGGGAAAGSGAVAATSSVTAGGSAAAGSAGLLAGGAGHVATLLAAAVVTAGGAVEIQSTLSTAASHRSHSQHVIAGPRLGSGEGSPTVPDPGGASAIVPSDPVGASAPGVSLPTPVPQLPEAASTGSAAVTHSGRRMVPITMLLDPDMYSPQNLAPTSPSSAPGPPSATGPATSTKSSAGAAAGSTPAGTGSGPGGASGTPSGSGVSSGPSTGSGSGTGASTAPPSSSNTPSSNAPASGSSPSGPAAPTTGSSTGPSSGTSPVSASTPSSTSVGRSTTSASSNRVVSFIAHRRTHHRRLDTLVMR